MQWSQFYGNNPHLFYILKLHDIKHKGDPTDILSYDFVPRLTFNVLLRYAFLDLKTEVQSASETKYYNER